MIIAHPTPPIVLSAPSPSALLVQIIQCLDRSKSVQVAEEPYTVKRLSLDSAHNVLIIMLIYQHTHDIRNTHISWEQFIARKQKVPQK